MKYNEINNIWMKILLAGTATTSFLCSYFLNLTMNNAEQYLAVVAVLLLDGFFGVWAGVKREGFKTYKALKVLKNISAWVIILTVILMVEKGFLGAGWMSETIIIPFMVFQLISALKNASMAGFIKMDELNKILDRIDKHKGFRQ
jgi:phage-related holin